MAIPDRTLSSVFAPVEGGGKEEGKGKKRGERREKEYDVNPSSALTSLLFCSLPSARGGVGGERGGEQEKGKKKGRTLGEKHLFKSMSCHKRKKRKRKGHNA